MKFSLLFAALLTAGLSLVSNSALAKDGYFFCTILANTGGSYDYKHILQKNIIKGDIGKDPRLVDKISEQYVEFIKANHGDWYQGYRVNSNKESAEFKIRSNTRCYGPFAALKDASAAQEQEVKDRNEKYAKDKNNGPLIVEDQFVYKP